MVKSGVVTEAPTKPSTSGDQNRHVLAQERRKLQLRYLVLLLPLVTYLAVFYAYPVAAMLFRSIAEPDWTVANFTKIVSSSVYAQVLWTTVKISLVVTIAALLLAYPVAYVLSSIRVSRANLLIILVLIPFWTSILVRTYAWMVLLGRQGIINQFLLWVGVVDQPIRLLHTTLAVYVAMVHILLPFMILPLYSVMRGIDRNLLRAAEGLGARPFQVFRQVLLPLSLPGIAAGCLLVFILSLGFFITPALVGGPKDVVIAVLIAQQVDLFDWPFASALATVLLAGSLLFFAIFNKALGVEEVFGRGRT